MHSNIGSKNDSTFSIRNSRPPPPYAQNFYPSRSTAYSARLGHPSTAYPPRGFPQKTPPRFPQQTPPGFPPPGLHFPRPGLPRLHSVSQSPPGNFELILSEAQGHFISQITQPKPGLADASVDFQTLLVKHIPPSLTDANIEDFFKHMGAKAKNITILRSKTRKTNAFVGYESREAAQVALFRLHQFDLFGSRLVVEVARKREIFTVVKTDKASGNNTETTSVQSEENPAADLLEKWRNKLDEQRHLYPDATGRVLANICNALASHPKFYAQTLQLMNRTRLPNPFLEDFPKIDSPAYVDLIAYISDEMTARKNGRSSGEEESDLDSESRVDVAQRRKKFRVEKIAENAAKVNKMIENMAKAKAKWEEKEKEKKKMAGIDDEGNGMADVHLCFPPVRAAAAVADVFEQPNSIAATKIISLRIPKEMKAKGPEDEAKVTSGGFGVFSPIKETPKEVDHPLEEREESAITEEELIKNRLSENNWKILPIFQNYQPGTPTCRLYIKNLSKKVVESDLTRIYKRYLNLSNDPQQSSIFDVRLMQKGKMKGQAFVTLENVNQAEMALKETNAFVLKDKPMVVQFARSAPSS